VFLIKKRTYIIATLLNKKDLLQTPKHVIVLPGHHQFHQGKHPAHKVVFEGL